MKMAASASKRLNVRLSAAEHEALVQKAKASGLSVSDFVRSRCFKEDDRPRIVVDTQMLKRLYSDQRRIGGLLNQLLRHANFRRQDFSELADQAQSVVGQLEKTTQEINQFIVDVYTSI